MSALDVRRILQALPNSDYSRYEGEKRSGKGRFRGLVRASGELVTTVVCNVEGLVNLTFAVLLSIPLH